MCSRKMSRYFSKCQNKDSSHQKIRRGEQLQNAQLFPYCLSVDVLLDRLGDTVLMAALRAGRHAAALLLLKALAVPTAAAHTFRYAWVIAAALSVRGGGVFTYAVLTLLGPCQKGCST